VAEDEQLQLLDRGASSYVGTFDDRPYIAPFHGNIIELCPVGALTSEAYRFRARPWEIEDAGSICTLCPSQCNVKLTVRDERIQRVLARDNAEVDDGWLCDKGRFGFQMVDAADRITTPMVREGGDLRPASWDEALEAAARGLRDAGARTAAIAGGESSNEEGYLAQRLVRRALGSPHVDSRLRGGIERETLLELSNPELAASVGDIDTAEAILVVGCDPLHAMPIVDLRIRKAVRRNRARLAIVSDRPTALDGGADEVARCEPGAAGPFLNALAAALGIESYESAPGERGADAERIAGALSPDSTVIVWSERVDADALVDCGRALHAKLLEVPEATNARGLREVGCLPTAGPGLSETATGRGAAEIREGLESGDLAAALLLEVDPVRDHPKGAAWDEALAHRFVVAFSMFENGSTAHADVVFPAEAYPEKEGTVTHPDGRLQRLRPGIPHAGKVRPAWEVLVELSAQLGHETGLDSPGEVFEAIASEVTFYGGITPEEIGGRGMRWQDRDAANAPRGEGARPAGTTGRSSTTGEGKDPRIQLGTYRDLWAAEVTQHSPALRFLTPKQTLELAPVDAERLGVAPGDEVEVRSNGTSVRARVALRERIRPGSGFMIEGLGDGAAALGGEPVEIRKAGEE
jgi:NADH-quinone oxidoreductase subunit G